MSSNDNESTTVEKVKRKKVPKPMFWSPECKYSVIMNVASEYGWKLVDEERLQSKVNLYWVDVALIHERFRTILPWQCINHFPGMPNIARKNRMGQNLNRMQKMFPREYSFYPRTWVLPGELADFRQQFDNNGVALNNKIFIIKPDAGCQGRGIFLTRTLDTVPVSENVVAQVYIKKPLLLDGFKFDLRIYVIVTSVKPLRMYLFHDGLVRMCTEEYVKPTKQNLGMMCMHLTNYAVNKHNENFQQPSASTSEECQDEGSKRSLLWFMNWVRKERGDAKADWLWKRIGVLCTRTLLSIMPTLSREYDQHFKSFSGIPVDMSKIQSPNREAAFAKPPPAAANVAGGNTSRGRPGRTATGNKEEGSDDEETNTEDNANGNNTDDGETNANESTKTGNSSPSPSPDDGLPKIRGSRCFEVLGFDIMMDNNLNPWLIEVNHLPSFGTDSPLDKDIKDRLMRQVFSVLPTRGDDYAAYVAHQKVESEKRLISQTKERQAKLEAARQAQQKPLPKPAPRPRPNPNNNPNNAANNSNTTNGSNGDLANAADNRSEDQGDGADNVTDDLEAEEEENLCSPERLEEIKKVLLDVYEKHSPEKVGKIDRLMVKYAGHEEEFLLFVFAKYGVSPLTYDSEVKRQQRLERIRRLREERTQNVSLTRQGSNNTNNSAQDNDQEEARDENRTNEGGDNDTEVTTAVGTHSEDASIVSGSRDTSALPKATDSSVNNNNNTNNNKAREPNKRYSRSLSPPRSSGTVTGNNNNSNNNNSNNNRRAVPAWKQSGADDDAQFREDVLATHVPTEDEEWLRFEMSRLTQCTRIFPLEPKGSSSSTNNNNSNGSTVDVEDGKEMQEDADDDNDATAAASTAGATTGNDTAATPSAAAAAAATPKSATYEEILFQVFLQDKRQTMRLRCPLPNRAIDPNNKDGYLPPLDGSSSSRASFSSMGTGKGVVGWKAPSKSNNNNNNNAADAANKKQPTQQQLEFAKRLSQGLSVSSKSNNNPNNNSNLYNNGRRFSRMAGQSNVVTVSTDPSIQYSVVLDPQEYSLSQGSLSSYTNNNNGQMQMQMPPQQAVYANGQEILWPSTKAHRLYEESRNNRMRIEAARANNGAILRQQIFYFDPNYDSYQPALVMGNNPTNPNPTNINTNTNSVVMGDQPTAGTQQLQPSLERRHSSSSSNNSVAQIGGVNDVMNQAQQLQWQQQQQQQQQQTWRGVGVGARPGVASSSTTNLNNANNNFNNLNLNGLTPQQQQLLLQQYQQRNLATNAGVSSVSSVMSANGQTIISGKVQLPNTNNNTGTQKMQYVSSGKANNNNNMNNSNNNAAMMGGQTKQEELLRQLFPSWF